MVSGVEEWLTCDSMIIAQWASSVEGLRIESDWRGEHCDSN